MRPAIEVDPLTLTAPRNASVLPVYELDRALVEKPRAPIPFDPTEGYKGTVKKPVHVPLPIAHWGFLHAWAKTRFQCCISEREIEEAALSRFTMSERALVWDPKNLRARNRSVFRLKDSSETYFSSCVAEACASLFMQRQDFVYWDHLPSLVNRDLYNKYDHPERTQRARVLSSLIPANSPAKEPDYLFEKIDGTSALMESKGILPSPTHAPPVKTRLRMALEQLKGWSRWIRPSPAKSFGVATVLREAGDSSDSHLAFVDPDPDPPREHEEAPLKRDWVRRGNYGAWLVGMGLTESGEALRWGRSKSTHAIRLPVLQLGSRRFAFTWRPMAARPVPAIFRPADWDALLFPGDDELFMLLVGIDVEVLTRLSPGIANGDHFLEHAPPKDSPPEEPGWKGSVFPDGTVIGALRWLPQTGSPISDGSFQL